MDMRLVRFRKGSDGVFSTLTGDGVEFKTVSHAYQEDGKWEPKVQPGVYRCVRGTHKLHDGKPFSTFEITGVTGHSGILFHVGNYSADSEGCECVGLAFVDAPHGMVTLSAKAFERFMQMQDGVNEFTLTVEDACNP